MAAATADDVVRGLAGGERGGTFFLYGDDAFLQDELIATIVAAHLDPATRDFNFDQYRGADIEPEALLAACATPPLMAEWRVVVLRDAQVLAAHARGRAALESLVERTVPGRALVISAQIPERSTARIYERLRRATTSVECAPLGAADLPGWLIARAAYAGVTLDDAAARALASANLELGVLVHELDKLREFVGERRGVTRADVEAVVGSLPKQNRWDWFDMVGERRFAEARATLRVLLDAGESGVGLLIGIGAQLTRVGVALAGGEPALQQALPPNQRWLAGRVARQARGWSQAQLDAALDDALRADRLLKSASLDDVQILEELLLRLQTRAALVAA